VDRHEKSSCRVRSPCVTRRNAGSRIGPERLQRERELICSVCPVVRSPGTNGLPNLPAERQALANVVLRVNLGV
jgi:hypothetical protein